MGVNIQEFANNRVIGNVKIGERNAKDIPVKYGYFNVHLDKMTSSLAVELFNEVYDKPKKLKIRFVNQNPMDIHLERYSGKKRVCYGNNKEAIYIDENGKKKKIKCNCKECDYALGNECKFIGRLYFILDKLEDEGIWCYPTGNQNGINKMLKRIVRANRLGEDLTKDWYELFLTPVPSSYKGINYVPDIRKLGVVNSKTDGTTNIQNQNNSINNQNKKNFLLITGFEKAKVENKEATKIIFKDTDSKNRELYLMPENSKQDIVNLKVNSVIYPLSISTRNDFAILNDYKIVKIAS